MFIDLFSFQSLGRPLRVLLLHMSLEGGDLLVDSSNILLDYVRQFLSPRSLLGRFLNRELSAYANFDRTIVEQGLPFSNLKVFVSKREEEMRKCTHAEPTCRDEWLWY